MPARLQGSSSVDRNAEVEQLLMTREKMAGSPPPSSYIYLLFDVKNVKAGVCVYDLQ